MSRPFHYSFFVRDLESTRRFYGELLGCTEGRSTESWVDFDFFGSQISAHLGEPTPTLDCGKVDNIVVPMPHFGAVLEWGEFERVAQRLRGASTQFIIEPYVRFAGMPGEQYTMFLRDPSGNAIEFKGFRSASQIFAT